MFTHYLYKSSVRLGFVSVDVKVAAGGGDPDPEAVQILGCDDLATQSGPEG